MSTVPAFASASEAMDMVHAGLGYLAASDATAMAAETQARCLRMLEQATAMGTAARASILAAFTSAQGYSADADYSPKAWLINRTRITKGAAVAYTAWAAVTRIASAASRQSPGSLSVQAQIVRATDSDSSPAASAAATCGCAAALPAQAV